MASLARAPRATGLVLSPADPTQVAVRAVFRFHLRAFAREEAAARRSEVEPVHQLRVATRRLRAALRLFEPVLQERFAASMRRDLAWLADAIGAVRDLDVLSETVAARAAKLDPGLRRSLGPLAVVIHDQRAAAHERLVKTLDSERARHLFDRLAAFAESVPRRDGDRLGDVAPSLIRPVLRAVLRAGRAVGAEAPPEALHRLRIRTKRLRYALETLHGLGGKAVRKTVSRLEALQDLLGTHQDAVTQVAWLRAYALAPEVPSPTVLAVGALIEAIDRQGRRHRGRFPDLWQRLDRNRLRRGVTADLAGERGRTNGAVRRLGATGS
jgi:triphosphatase